MLCFIALVLLQTATVALLVVLATVYAYPYPGYESGLIEDHGLSLGGHGLALEGTGGLEGHAVGAYIGHGGETDHGDEYYVSIPI